MFGDDDGGADMFTQGAPAATANPRSGAPLVSNGLFGDAALKDDDPAPKKGGNAGSKLNSIFDYEEEETP